MAASPYGIGNQAFLARSALQDLIRLLRQRGYTVLAPRLQDGVVSLRPVEAADDLPQGWRDEQSGGNYRLVKGDPDLRFEFVVGPDGPKRYLFPPNQRLFSIHIEGGRFVMDDGPPQIPKLAFLGVRPCEVAAMKVQDRVFGLDDPATVRCESEVFYTQTRREALVIAANCIQPGGTCFCTSMGTGPQVSDGYDLALTELRGGFVLAVGSDRGADVARELPLRDPTSAELELAELKLRGAREHMGRRLDTAGLKEALHDAIESHQWADVAQRCLACGNCTMVCPTCFCSTVSDSTGLADPKTTRTRQWESCYTHQFSYTTAGPVRSTIRGRYRHWLRHKLGTWWEQFNTSGCVGCGRCITWCPVGIDVTVEAERLQQSAGSAPARKETPR